jgi:hypothetical protein
MSRLTFRVLVSLVISLVVVAAVFASVQAASQNVKSASAGAYVSRDSFTAKSLKQDAFKSYSHGDFDCGYGWMIDPDD